MVQGDWCYQWCLYASKVGAFICEHHPNPGIPLLCQCTERSAGPAALWTVSKVVSAEANTFTITVVGADR